jgi:hypothetical protein
MQRFAAGYVLGGEPRPNSPTCGQNIQMR